MSEPLKHEGKWASRMEYPCHSTDRERAFAEAWRRENERSHTLSVLLHSYIGKNALGQDAQLLDRSATQEEATAAATLIQWLGTNCGFCFLEEALRTAGYSVRRHKEQLSR